jgi:hypothetical protein
MPGPLDVHGLGLGGWIVLLEAHASVMTVIKNRENFTKGYRIIPRFDRRVLKYHSSRTRGLNYQNESHKGIQSGFGVKSSRKWSHMTST